MKVAQLQALLADLPADMPVVIRLLGEVGESISGIHIRTYNPRLHQIQEPAEVTLDTQVVVVLNPWRR